MADLLLLQVLRYEVDHEIIITAIKNGSAIKCKDVKIPLVEFIPHFLAYLHEKLNVSVNTSNAYLSPRQLEKRKQHVVDVSEGDGGGDTKKAVPKKSPRLSLQYASSSPMKKIEEGKHEPEISGISPIKTVKLTHQKKKKYAIVSPVQNNNPTTNNTSKTNFELNSFDDFPAISFTSAPKNPRRIRATTVTTSKSSFSSSKNDTSQPSFSFLEESSFESQHCNPSLDKLFLDDKRFARSSTDLSAMSVDGNLMQSTCDELDFSSLMTKKVTPPKISSENIDIGNIADKDVVDFMIEIYVSIWMRNLIPNFTLELYFLFITLTIPLKANQDINLVHPFHNIESCVYFAASSLERLFGYISLLDEKSLNLLVSNTRLKQITSSTFLSDIQDIINNDVNSISHKRPDIAKSPMTGIPFQVESDNRKSFVSDKHFHLFSKKRDAFYALVREWQDNYLDPDWNMKQFMARKVPEIMKMNVEISTHYQFAKLFVAQLLEMCRNYVGGKNNESDESESSLLIDLKKRNPSKYQSLQDRLTQPSFSNDPCPKPSFSIVEQFFKEFVDIADSYCFSKILQHVLITYILEINSRSFGLESQKTNSFNRSDFADSLWLEIKMAVSELRLLAKFLGYIIFRPYNYSSDYIDDKILKSRYLLIEPLDLSDYLYTSYKKHTLLITVPWVVDFFSMADKHAFDHVIYHKTMKYLVCLYQSTFTRVQNNLLLMSLMLHIGWLFELPHIENLKFYEPDSQIQNIFHNDELDIGIDDIVSVDKEFFYSLCPYLNDIKKPLVDFAKGSNLSMSGSFRKITPVRTSDIFSIDTRSNLKNQLIDSLLRYVSNHVKDVMKFVTEKHFVNIKNYICDVILPECCQNVLEKIKKRFQIDGGIGDITSEELKLNNSDVYKEYLELGKDELASRRCEYIKSYLQQKVYISMEALLPHGTHKKVQEVTSKVVKHNIRLKLQEWITLNYDLYQNETNLLYTRYIKNVVKSTKDVTI